MAAEAAGKVAREQGMRQVEVYVKGPGAGRESAIRALANCDMEVTLISDVSPIPHNGCRPPKNAEYNGGQKKWLNIPNLNVVYADAKELNFSLKAKDASKAYARLKKTRRSRSARYVQKENFRIWIAASRKAEMQENLRNFRRTVQKILRESR